MFTKIFYNPVEERLRAGWRILIFTSLLMVLGIALNTISVSSLFFTIGLAIIVLISLWIAAVSMGVIFIILLNFGWITFINTSFVLSAELVSYLIFMIAVSIWEEGFFRSYLIPNIKEGVQSVWISKRWALIFAVFISSFLFSLGHLANPGATYLSTVNIFAAGVVLAYPFIATGNIGLSVGLHFSWNYFQSAVFGLPVSGTQFNQGILQSNINGPELFTGGKFGPEGGIIGFIGLIVMIIFTHIYVILQKRKLQNRF